MSSVYYASASHDEDVRDQAFTEILRRTEFAIFLLLIFIFSTALLDLFLNSSDDPSAVQHPLVRFIWYPAYGLIALVTLRRLPQVMRLAVFNPLLVLCVLWCGITYFWSIDTGITMRRVIALLMTTIFGLVLAARYDWNAMVQRLALVFAGLAFVSLFVSLALPSYGVHAEIHPGAWRGAWTQKNYFGASMTKGLLLMMCAFAMRPDRGWFWIPMGVLCFALVVLSTSKTSLLVSLAMIAGFFALRIFRRYPGLRIPLMYSVLFAAGLFATLMMTIPDEMFALIGKERTLTGRTDIWNELIISIKQKPWLGYGYGVYWLDPLGASYHVRRELEWGVPSAHNGWIETWLSAGGIAVGMFALLSVLTLMLAIDRIKHGGVEVYWAVLSTVLFLMFSMSESTILQQNDLSWVMFVATSSKLFAFERPYWRDKARLPYFLARRGAG